MHANPSIYRKLIKNDGIAVPPTIEITFLRNDVLEGLGQIRELSLPHALDNPNSAKHKEISLPEIWWKK